MPGDYDIEYTSPWAGANVLPMNNAADQRWERRTWPELSRLAAEVPEAGIHFQNCRILRREVDANNPEKNGYDPLFDADPWYIDLFPDHRVLTGEELPEGYVDGAEFTSVCLNTAVYLPWLVGQCRRLGVVFKRGVLKHVCDAVKYGKGKEQAEGNVVVVNCSGLQACRLGGVMDQDVYPARGQTVIVRNEVEPMIALSGTADGEDELCYTMTRAAGGGTIIGGSYQKGNWEANPDMNLAIRIMKRAVEIQPELAGGRGIEGLDIIRHGVGLRPARNGGVRIESEVIQGVTVVHNYGHAGWGYQGSYGCAERVVELVNEVAGKEIPVR